jgi:N-acetylneuraminic acid mutarotase
MDAGGDVVAEAATDAVDSGACGTDAAQCTPGATQPATLACSDKGTTGTQTCGADCTWGTPACTLIRGWRPMAAPPSGFGARDSGAAFLVGSKVLFGGGVSGSSATPPSGLLATYDVATDTWVEASSPGASFSGEYSVTVLPALGGAFVWGGLGASNTPNVGAALYQPSSDGWSKVDAPFPLGARLNVASAHLEGLNRVFLWGGNAGSTCLNDGATYDLLSSSWHVVSASPLSAREGAFAFWNGAKVVVFGGADCAGNVLWDGAVYDPAADTWSTLPAPPGDFIARLSPDVWSTPSMAALVAGFNLSGSTVTPVSTIASLDLATLMWRDLTAPSTALSWRPTGGNASWCATGQCFVWGGPGLDPKGEVVGTSDGLTFDTSSNAWSAMPTAGAPKPRSHALAVWTGREAVIWGGQPFSGADLADGAIYVP